MQPNKEYDNYLYEQEVRRKDAAIHHQNVEKGFWEDYDAVKALLKDSPYWPIVNKWHTACRLMLVVSELSEALEADRKDLMDDKLPHRKGLEVELADAAIRIRDLGEGLGMDLVGAETEKLDYNLNRPHKHGKVF